jgi:uncharacterized protein YcaQ
MEMLQVGFLIVGIFVLWSSMNLAAPAPVTPNDVTGELNSMLEFIQKLRKRPTALADSDRRKQEQLDKIFDEIEAEIQDLLDSIEEKGELMKARNETNPIDYTNAWDDLDEQLGKMLTQFKESMTTIGQDMGVLVQTYNDLNEGQVEIKRHQHSTLSKAQASNSELKKILELYH